MMAHFRATRALEGAAAGQYEAACGAMTRHVIPYIAACYGRVYPDQRRLVDAGAAAAPLAAAHVQPDVQPGAAAQQPSGGEQQQQQQQ